MHSNRMQASSQNVFVNTTNCPIIKTGLTVQELKTMTAMRVGNNIQSDMPSPRKQARNKTSCYQTATPRQLQAAGIPPIVIKDPYYGKSSTASITTQYATATRIPVNANVFDKTCQTVANLKNLNEISNGRSQDLMRYTDHNLMRSNYSNFENAEKFGLNDDFYNHLLQEVKNHSHSNSIPQDNSHSKWEIFLSNRNFTNQQSPTSISHLQIPSAPTDWVENGTTIEHKNPYSTHLDLNGCSIHSVSTVGETVWSTEDWLLHHRKCDENQTGYDTNRSANSEKISSKLAIWTKPDPISSIPCTDGQLSGLTSRNSIEENENY